MSRNADGCPGKANSARGLMVVLAAALLARVVIAVSLSRAGYYYGEDSDSFWRLGLSWRWSNEPFFNDTYWVPMQFAIVGATFAVLRPVFDAATMVVPIAWNHLFFIGSLGILWKFASDVGGRAAGVISVALAVSMTEDIWTTFSGLAEPLVVLCGLVVGYCIYSAGRLYPSVRIRSIALMVLAASVASATHYEGWFIVVVVALFIGFAAWREVRSPGSRRNQRLGALLGLALLLASFPVAWLAGKGFFAGQPLHLLQTAQGYHEWFLKEPVAVRLASVPVLMWNTAPAMVLASLAALPVVIARKPGACLFLIPGVVYAGCLAVAGTMAYAVPSMHQRYALLPMWELAPFLGVACAQWMASRNAFKVILAAVVIAGVTACGIRGAFTFTNWVDSATRNVASLLDHRMASAFLPIDVVVESESCMYPVGAIANSVRRPDWVRVLSGEKIVALALEPRTQGTGPQVLVVTNPVTKRRLEGITAQWAAVGDYTALTPLDGGTYKGPEVRPPADWEVLPGTTLLLSDTSGGTYFGFDPAPLAAGDACGIELHLATPENGCVLFHAQIQDRFQPDEYPWALVQQLVVNGIVMWSHDVSEGGTCGWQDVDFYLMPARQGLDIQLRVLAVTGPRMRLDWPYASLTGVRDVRLSRCP